MDVLNVFPQTPIRTTIAEDQRVQRLGRDGLGDLVARVLAPAKPVLVGASGGGDSTALMVMLAPVASAQGRALVAGIVDHGLRPGSDADARRAADIAASLGANPHVVRLAWPDGPQTSQQATRVARYGALARLARKVGAGTLFLGHTADDQAETVFLRRAAGSGDRGLAGMAAWAPCPVWPEGRDLMLARPLLGMRRAELRDLLRREGVSWLEDPANALVRFARVRARAALADGGAEALIAEAAAHAAAAAALDDAARAWLAGADLGDDSASLPAATAGNPAHIRALAAVAAAYGGAIREPTPAAAQRLAARLAAGQDGTLSGARFRAGSRLQVSRDPGGVLGRRGGGAGIAALPLPAGETVVWDNRLALTAPGAGWVAAAPAPGDPLVPRLHGPGPSAAVAARWLPAGRVERLIYRAESAI